MFVLGYYLLSSSLPNNLKKSLIDASLEALLLGEMDEPLDYLAICDFFTTQSLVCAWEPKLQYSAPSLHRASFHFKICLCQDWLLLNSNEVACIYRRVDCSTKFIPRSSQVMRPKRTANRDSKRDICDFHQLLPPLFCRRHQHQHWANENMIGVWMNVLCLADLLELLALTV